MWPGVDSCGTWELVLARFNAAICSWYSLFLERVGSPTSPEERKSWKCSLLAPLPEWLMMLLWKPTTLALPCFIALPFPRLETTFLTRFGSTLFAAASL